MEEQVVEEEALGLVEGLEEADLVGAGIHPGRVRLSDVGGVLHHFIRKAKVVEELGEVDDEVEVEVKLPPREIGFVLYGATNETSRRFGVKGREMGTAIVDY